MSTAKINIAGKQIGLRFAYPCIRWFAEASEKSGGAYFLPGDKGDFTVEGLAKLIQCSYWNECLIKEIDRELDYEAFVNWVAEIHETAEGQEELGRIIGIYAESSVMKKIIEEQKKSLMETAGPSTSMESNPSATENSESTPGN